MNEPIGIAMTEGKPDGVGTYIAIVPGLSRPELVRVVRRDGFRMVEGSNWVMSLEAVGGGWMFSQRLDLSLSPAGRVVVEPEKEPT